MQRKRSSRGKRKQEAQGHHGWKGSDIGVITGSSSLSSTKYAAHLQRKKLGVLLHDNELGGRPRKPKTPEMEKLSIKAQKEVAEENRIPFSYANFTQQLYFVGVYNKLRAEQGFVGKPLLKAAREYCVQQNIEDKYIEIFDPPGVPCKNKKSKKRELKIKLNRFIDDQLLVKVAVCCKEGEQKNFHKPTPPIFDYEKEIEDTLFCLMRRGKRWDSLTINTVAMQCAFKKGYCIKIEKEDKKLFSKLLLQDFYADMNNWITENNEKK
eukprot:546940_1